MEPFRAFGGDKVPHSQRTSGFGVHTFLLGLAAVIAAHLACLFTHNLDIRNNAPEDIIPDSVKYSFYIGGVVFLAAVLWTVFTTKEYPPEDMSAWEEEKRRTRGVGRGFAEIIKGIGTMPKTMLQLAI